MKNNGIVIVGIMLSVFMFPFSVGAPATMLTYAASTEQGGVPVRVIIPKSDINARVVPVGKDKNGYMEVPQDPTDIGWYAGTALFDGHLDTETEPAVLYSLKNLQKGDDIIVIDSHSDIHHYTVSDSTTYDAYTFPMGKLLMENKNDVISFITCAGEFDSLRHAYMERLVVTAKRE